MYADHYVSSEMSFRAQEEQRAAQEAAKYRELRDDYIEAVLCGSQERLPTPAFRNRDYTAADLIADYECSGIDICRLLVACERSADPAIRIAAQAILSKAADEYARTHAEASL